jgi:integrase/recombinase XerD
MGKEQDPASPGQSLLVGHLGGFTRWMEEQAYSASTVEQYRVIAGRFDNYLTIRKVDIACLNRDQVDAYLAQVEPRRPRGRKDLVADYYRQACRRLLEYLREIGAIPTPAKADPGPAILRDYLSFLRHHRALGESSIGEHERWLLRFLGYLGMEGETDELRQISLARIDGFLIEATKGLKRTSIGHVAASVRGFLRYLYMRGVLPQDLREHVATPRIYSLEGIPRAIDWAEVERALDAVDRSAPSGRRDFAILALLAYCGLRAGEVAALRLDAVDWRHDTIRVRRGKSDTVDGMPLVPIVGGALLEYLKCRPRSPHPELILKLIAPAGPMSGAGIGFVARKYLRAAGVKAPQLGAHTFRHSYAVRLLRKGFPLKTIGDALGHRNPQSTFIYTKATTEDLRSVALEISEVRK